MLLKVMQSDDLDILAVLPSLLRSIKEVEKLSSTHLDRWPTYAATVQMTMEPYHINHRSLWNLKPCIKSRLA